MVEFKYKARFLGAENSTTRLDFIYTIWASRHWESCSTIDFIKVLEQCLVSKVPLKLFCFASVSHANEAFTALGAPPFISPEMALQLEIDMAELKLQN